MSVSINRFLHSMITGILLCLIASSFLSCENDIKAVSKLNRVDTLPTISIQSMEVKQSESGKLSMILTAPLMKAYTGVKPRTVFPKGVHIVFYDSLKQPVSDLTAGYGVRNDVENTMEARINVIVHNLRKSTTLNTEELIWNKNTRKTTSTKFVKITSPDRIIMGEGMESDEIFDDWNIKNVRGIIYVNEMR
jgi:LPS export ABC transporter protein LptC